MPKSPKFYDTDAAAAKLGLSRRSIGRISINAGIQPLNFSNGSNSKNFKWTEEMLQQIDEWRQTNHRDQAAAIFRPPRLIGNHSN